MLGLQLVTHTIEVPRNTGIEGFLHTVRELLKLSRIQSIVIDAKGKVTYKRYTQEDEPQLVGVDYSGVEPWHVARNAPDGVTELPVHPSTNAALVLTLLLEQAVLEKLYPIAFVSGANTVLWSWFEHSTQKSLRTQSALCGFPLHLDRHIPDTALVLCASFARDGALIDTQKAYKIEMDYRDIPKTEVEVMDDV